ncbi:isopentenyl-diphosphate Delta-isomerase [Mucilaginibacter sp.]|uniref:isopentenyl-diphosphate Delta-isomerase n=1 Tax=Mucilaginibacter sp. TaxID=1882438 RepID=UPI0028400C75|nr:isopentenyl-diphosphate Delta-isomerase [Mucilaginibacter sp.]MDR3693645.1 isopentenyl-diphosphate Delta-isomerase [Mucilaginibacter sp.]
MIERVILVDELDNMTGTMEKMEAHRLGVLHRAFSIFIFNKSGALLLQQRAHNKYHSGGKWTNTCCSHPPPGEKTLDAAHRRLYEEMGMECELHYAFNFIYRAGFEDGMSEHELDHVFWGVSDCAPIPEPNEVAAFEFISVEELAADLKLNPGLYTEWLKICFEKVIEIHKQIF